MEDIQNSIDELGMRLSEVTEQIQEMNALFSKATEDLGKGTDEAILQKLDNIISQNEKIAQAILALADMMKNNDAESMDESSSMRPSVSVPSPAYNQQRPQQYNIPNISLDDGGMEEMPLPEPEIRNASMQRQMPPLPQQMPPLPPQRQAVKPQEAPQPTLQPPVPLKQPPQDWQYPADDLKPLPLYPPKRPAREELKQFNDPLPPPPRNPMPRPGMF